MKILNAIHAQGIGGVDQVFRNYSEILLQKNHQVALLISDNGYDKYAAKKIFKLKNSSQIFDCIKLLWILLTFKPDVVLCHSRRLMKWMKIMRFFSKTKSVAINHGISFESSLNCDYVININQQISDLVVKTGFDKEKSFVLPNVIKVDQKYRAKTLKIAPTIGIYGRIEPRKGFDILIEAAGILLKNGHDFRLKIGGFEVAGGYTKATSKLNSLLWYIGVPRNAGRDSCRVKNKKYNEVQRTSVYNLNTIKEFTRNNDVLEKCEFVGTVLDKSKFFENVDIFCVPSREEPFGLVILEGFLFSTLVISSNTDGGKLLIKNDEDGLLFENENAKDLAQKIIKVLSNPEIYASFTNKAFSKLEKEFSFDFLAQEIEKILTKIS
jgi:glycosyltransferase involved in cell wall biosynthesis